MSNGKRWIINDSDGNSIYLTEERWQHIVDPDNHLEMADYEEYLKTTIRLWASPPRAIESAQVPLPISV